MKVTVPDDQWTVYEDVPDEFTLSAPNGRLRGTIVGFWRDPQASTPRDVPVRLMGRTPSALVAWLRHDPPTCSCRLRERWSSPDT